MFGGICIRSTSSRQGSQIMHEHSGGYGGQRPSVQGQVMASLDEENGNVNGNGNVVILQYLWNIYGIPMEYLWNDD